MNKVGLSLLYGVVTPPAAIGATFILYQFLRAWYALANEGKEKGKQIEYALLIVTFLSVVVAVSGVVYNVYVTDKLDKRISEIEQRLD